MFPLPWTELTCWIYTEVRNCPGIIICLVNSSETKLVRSSKVFMFLLWIDISGSLIKVHYQFSQAIELKLVSIPLFWVTKPPTTSQDRRPHHQPILKKIISTLFKVSFTQLRLQFINISTLCKMFGLRCFSFRGKDSINQNWNRITFSLTNAFLRKMSFPIWERLIFGGTHTTWWLQEYKKHNLLLKKVVLYL